MAAKPSARAVRAPPPPSTAHAGDGMEVARELARRYLPDAVVFLAGLAFAPDSEAPLHTKMMATKELVSIAGVPQPTPMAPAPAPLLHENPPADHESN
jgi:hypothetical protein